MFAFLRKQKPPARTSYRPFPSGYNADEFRENASMVLHAQEWQRSALGGHMMAVLHNSIPYGYPMRGSEVSPTAAALELGRMQGYMDCLNLLNAICTPQPTQNEVPQDYQAEEILAND